jgi:parallel beta-helix repeat protein
MKRKCLAVGIILLFVGTCIIPAIAQTVEKPTVVLDGHILYVGGSGPGNYTKIQDAIDNASDGDTVFVYEGIYNESIVIDKIVILTGEDKNLTVINSQDFNDTIRITALGVIISGFTIQHSESYYPHNVVGINLISSLFVTISDNIIKGNYWGIEISDSHQSTIVKNIICENVEAISCVQSGGIFISENNISDNTVGILIQLCYGCYIIKNFIYNNNYIGVYFITSQGIYVENNSIMFNSDGISIVSCSYCKVVSNQIFSNEHLNMDLENTIDSTIKHNVFANSTDGIFLLSCFDTILSENSISNHTAFGIVDIYSEEITVTRNNFRNNKLHASFKDSLIYWNENYWGRPMRHPKLIIGGRTIMVFNHNLSFLKVNFDWHPAKTPYDIGG